jgi:hypothetical protein
MRQSMMTVMALVAFGAMVATAQAEKQTASPPTASHPVKKQTVSQTARPSRSVSAAQSTCTGLELACLSGSECIPSPIGRGLPQVYPDRSAVCFGRSTQIISPKTFCNSTWDQCMKTGFWEGDLIHRPAERR